MKFHDFKAKKEFFILLISIMLFIVFSVVGYIYYNRVNKAPVDSVESSDTNKTETSFIFSDKYYYNQLTDIEKIEFQKIYKAISSYSKPIPIDNLSVDSLNKIIYIIHFDCPEIFFLSDSSQNFNHIGNKATVYYPQYTYTEETIELMRKEIESISSNFLFQIKNLSAIDAEKAIHDYLISHVSYSQDTENCSNIYGAIVEGKANCKGYSSAFTYLARKLNIPSAQVIGYASNSNNSVGHSWNIVKIYDYYYYVDVCWDDFDENEEYNGLKGSYIFYNLPANKMVLSHNPSETLAYLGELPTDNDSSYIYYKTVGFYATDQASAQEIITKGLARISQGETEYIILQCDNTELYNLIKSSIQTIIRNEIEKKQYLINGCGKIEIDNGNTIILTNFSMQES